MTRRKTTPHIQDLMAGKTDVSRGFASGQSHDLRYADAEATSERANSGLKYAWA